MKMYKIDVHFVKKHKKNIFTKSKSEYVKNNLSYFYYQLKHLFSSNHQIYVGLLKIFKPL